MATETDMRLRSWLDSNQRDREQMCRAVLALDERYSDVRPRHPHGGPDGGRDIEATYEGGREAYGAVGFANGANDSDEQKKQIRKKFSDDLRSALRANPQLKAFAFLTNLHFTMGEQDAMKKEAKKAGIEHCDVLDRERIRIELDSPSGFFIRFQYLSVPLSEAEQASFLSRYGSQIQDVVTTGFQRVEKTLNRLLFLSESADVLDALTFRFVLKESYPASAIGHLRAFVFLSLREIKHDIFCLWFGTSDRADRFRDDKRDTQPGIGNGRSSGQWEQHVRLRNGDVSEEGGGIAEAKADLVEKKSDRFKQVGWSSGVGMDPVPIVIAKYTHDETLIRFHPRLSLRDVDDCSFLPFLNASLAEKLHSFQVFANGYKLADFGPEDFRIDPSKCGEDFPGDFTEEELADPWVRIRPSKVASNFHLRFAETTPRRMFGHDEPNDSSVPASPT
jgi:hypothetical protein